MAVKRKGLGWVGSPLNPIFQGVQNILKSSHTIRTSFILTACLGGVACVSSSLTQTPSSGGTGAVSSAAPLDNMPASFISRTPWADAFQVYRYKLSNGLKILVVPDDSSPTFAYQTWYQVGSINEVVGKTGLAHLFEHMMFKATKNHPDGQFIPTLSQAGAYGLNASTSQDYTVYMQELPQKQFSLIAGFEADRMTNLVVDDQALKTELKVVKNERKMRVDNDPDGQLEEALMRLAYPNHPYGWPVIGFEADLDAVTAKDAVGFYEQFYSPNHATLVVVGAVAPNEVVGQVESLYGSYLPKSQPVLPPEPEFPSKIVRETLRLTIQNEKLKIAFGMGSLVSPDKPVLDLIAALLAGGKSSRLIRALVNTGIATSVDADAGESRSNGLFTIHVNLQKGKHSSSAESIVLAELAKMSQAVVSQEELKRALIAQEMQYYQALESNYSKARLLGFYETVAGDFNLMQQQFDQLKTVTAEQIKQVCQKTFPADRRIVVSGISQIPSQSGTSSK
jgi:zinc protease